MSGTTNSIMTGIHVVDGVLVVQAPDTFDDDSLRALRSCVLEKVHALGSRGVVLDVSTLRVLDSVSYGLLADTARTLSLLGARTVFSGFQPGVVAALIEFNVDSRDIRAVPSMADGLALLRPEPEREAEEEEEQAEELKTREDQPEDSEGETGDDALQTESDGYEDEEPQDAPMDGTDTDAEDDDDEQ